MKREEDCQCLRLIMSLKKISGILMQERGREGGTLLAKIMVYAVTNTIHDIK